MGSNLTYLHLIYLFVHIESMLRNVVHVCESETKNMYRCENCLCFHKRNLLFNCKTEMKLSLSYVIYDCAMRCYNGLSILYTSYT